MDVLYCIKSRNPFNIKKMNKFLKIFLVFLVLLTAVIVFSLQFMKPRLGGYIKQMLNNSVDARVDYDRADISLFQAFPGVSVMLGDIRVLGKEPESRDTLAIADRFSVAFDALSLFTGEFKVHSVRVDRPRIMIRKDSAGNSNWDIFPATDDTETVRDTSRFNLSLRDFRIREGFIAMYDSTKGNSVVIDGLNHEMRGRLDGKSSTLVTRNAVNKLTVSLGGLPLIQESRTSFNAKIDADLEKRKFTLEDNRLGLNDLDIVFNGTVSLLDSAVNTDLDFKADKAALKEFLSLLPAIYSNNYEKLDAEGEMALSGHVKGLYAEGQLPAFRIDVAVDNGSFGYQGVAVKAQKVGFRGSVVNPGGDADKTTISVPKLSLSIDGEPFTMSLAVRTPVSDPYIEASVNGSVDLADFQRIYPVKGARLAGEVRSNMVVKGHLSAFNTGQTGLGETEAYGSVVAKGVTVASDRFTPDISVASVQLNVSPGYLDLVDLQMKTGKSDYSANGRLENYLAYLMRKGSLEGRVAVRSDLVQLDEYRSLEEEAKGIMLPGRVSMTVNGDFDKVKFGEMLFEQAKGVVILEDEKLEFRDINAATLGGSVAVNGFYSTKGGKTDADFSITAAEMNITRSYESLKLLETVAPVADYAKGDVSARLNMRSRLDENLKPVLETVTGKGSIETKGLVIEDFPPIRKLALLLDVEELDTLQVPEAALDFAIDKGLVTTAPFSFRINDIKLNASGVTGFDKSLDWKIGLVIPKKYIGKTGIQTLGGLLAKLPIKDRNVTLPDTVIVDAVLKGSIQKPQIGLDLGKTADRIAISLKEELQKNVADDLLGRILPGSKPDSSAADSGGFKENVKKGIRTILQGDSQDSPGKTVDSAKQTEGILKPLLDGILSSPAKQPVEESADSAETGTADSLKKNDRTIDSTKQASAQKNGVADSVSKRKSVLDLF